VKRLGATVLVITAAAALAVPSAASASVTSKQKQVSVEKYAKTVCRGYLTVTDRYSEFTDSYNAITNDDPAAFQTEAVALADSLIADVTATQTKLKKNYPDIDDGKVVGKLFVSNIEEILTEVSDARDKFQAADASGVAFVADVSVFEVALNVLSVKLSDPFSEVDDQDLLKAFKDEKSCKDVVTIYGG
jgi:hypothetical protein